MALATRKHKSPGRPPIPVGERHSVNLHVRILEEEAAAFRETARNLGLDVSAWVRMLARRECGLTK